MRNTNTPKVISSIVNNDLCIGCGICVYKCPSDSLQMNWDNNGFIVPVKINDCTSDGDCLTVCPFNPWPEKEVETENELANIFLQSSKKKHPKIGHYNNIYVGYANQHRLNASSGGVATYIFTKLLETGIIDHVLSVKESNKPNVYYEYTVSSTKEELFNASKTKYFPVTLGTVMPKIKDLKGKVAIVGVGCFIKAIRLAQHREPELKEKIPFLVGIICGGIKSSFFTEYLAGKAGVSINNIQKPNFRIKDYNSTANDYSFGCIDKASDQNKSIKMKIVGDMWGTGMFKANACDFCDDVTTELADISLGDAWIAPYYKDGKGTNVVITRTPIASQLINSGIENKELSLKDLSLTNLLISQNGSFNHRHTGLSTRIKTAKRKGKLIPPKRFINEKITLDFKLVQIVRMLIRKKSLMLWKKTKNSKDFDRKMSISLYLLKTVTRINHHKKKLLHKIKGK